MTDGLRDKEASVNRRHNPRHHTPRRNGDTSQNRTSVHLHQNPSGVRQHRSLRPPDPGDKGGGTDGDIVGGAGGGGAGVGGGGGVLGGGGGGISRSTNHSTRIYSGGGTGGASLSGGGGAVGYPQKATPSGGSRGGAADLVHEHAHKKPGSGDAEQTEYMQGFGVRTRRDKDGADRNKSQCPTCVNQDVFHKKRHRHNYVEQEEHDTLHEVAHGLHFASISLLGFLVIEVSGLSHPSTLTPLKSCSEQQL